MDEHDYEDEGLLFDIRITIGKEIAADITERSIDLNSYTTHFSVSATTDEITGKRRVAFLRGTILRTDWLREDGESVWDACDSESQELSEWAAKLFDGDELRREVVGVDDEHLKHTIADEIMLIDRVYVFRRYRGHGVAMRLITEALAELGGGCCLVALKPWPLRYDNETVRKNRTAQVKEAPIRGIKDATDAQVNRMVSYWRKQGFVKIDRECMVLPVEAGFVRPGFGPKKRPAG